MLPGLVELRRALHRWPELGLDLPRTRERVLDALEGLPLSIRVAARSSSLVARLAGANGDRAIVLRADMDALPVEERTGLQYASERPGMMHACGHDAHVAMLVGAARLLAERQDELEGTVHLVFQAGEEGHHGAESMLAERLVPTGPGTAALALHSLPTLRSGAVAGRPGPMLASSDEITVLLRGRGGHAASPHEAVDATFPMCEVVLAVQAVVARELDAFDPAVVSVTQLHAGAGGGVIPAEATATLSVRALSETTRRALACRIRQVAEGVALAHRVSADVATSEGYPVTENDPAFTALAMDVARDLLGPGNVGTWPNPSMSADDFGEVLRAVPGALLALGTRPPGVSAPAPNHSPLMTLDEGALATGAALHAAVALAHLQGGS